jgi:hypothetical protein
MLRDQVADASVDPRQSLLERLGGARADHPAVERGELAAARQDDAVARVGGAGVDAEDDHHR